MLSKTGSYRTNPNGTTTSYDKYGRKTGSFKTDSTGKTTQYDRYAEKLELETGKKVVTDSNFLPNKQPKQIKKKDYLGKRMYYCNHNRRLCLFAMLINSQSRLL